MKNNENKKICAECGGKCCKAMPCSLSPEDAVRVLGGEQLNKENILKLLKTGLYSVNWWEGDIPEYYLRPRIKGCERMFDPSFGGECIFLTSTGCRLSFENRPQGGKDLVPSFSGCNAGGKDKRYYATLWKPYWEIIEELRAEYDDNSYLTALLGLMDMVFQNNSF